MQSSKPAEQLLATGIERKLLVVLMLSAVVPALILIAGIVIVGFRFEAMIAAIACQLIGFGLGYVRCLEMVQQTNSITATLARIKDGDFEARTELITSDELGEAAEAINAICDNTLNLIQSNDEQERIQNSIENLIAEMKSIAAGDLTVTSVVNEDITGSIAASVNDMSQQLRTIVERVQSAAETVTASSAQIRENSGLMSSESDDQANRIGEAARQLVQMTESFQHVAGLSRESMQVAVEARQTAASGLKAVTNTVDGMKRIRNQVQHTSRRIKSFGESSQEIGEIVKLISDIADQTSILAMNASIQASMAGDAGQGFAIVAEEIERLADRSADATKQISKLIRGIQNETRDVICEMEESTREVVAGSQLAAQAGETWIEIDAVSKQLVNLIQNSSSSMLEQAGTARVVADQMASIARSTRESAEKSRESTRSVGQLAETVNQLRGYVSQFKVTAQPPLPQPTSFFPMQTGPQKPVRPAQPRTQPQVPARKSLVERLASVESTNQSSQPPAITAPTPIPAVAITQPARMVQKTVAPQPTPPRDVAMTMSVQGNPNPQVCKTMMVGGTESTPQAAVSAMEESAIDDKLMRQVREAEAMLKQRQTTQAKVETSPTNAATVQ